jgi:hypothetical protein
MMPADAPTVFVIGDDAAVRAAVQGRTENCDSRIEGSAIALKYCCGGRHNSSQRASLTARLQGSGG